MPVCKLCGSEGDNFPKSHIIPKFMFKNLKDAKSRIMRLRMPAGQQLRSIPDGIYEKPLLCSDCELSLSKYEGYAEKALYGSTHIKVPRATPVPGTSFQSVTDIDYTNFKLFLLSILWKASVSSREFFDEVNLGAEHETAIAKLLLMKDAGAEDQYPVLMIIPKGAIGRDIGVLQPYRNKGKGNVTRYIFPICEAIYVFHISKHGIGDLQKTGSLKKDNTMNILYSPKPRIDLLMELYNVSGMVRAKMRSKLFPFIR